MGQPTPPGDNVPLYEGLGADWNDIVGAFPEDQRAELAPKLKERISQYEEKLQAYAPWEEFRKSGITPEHADTALKVYSTIENDPKQVYDTIAKYLNITPAQAEEVVEEIQESDSSDPRILALQEQINTMAQVMIAERQNSTQKQIAEAEDAKLDKEISDLKKKYGNDLPEDEIVMRMIHKGLSAEDAYKEYDERATQIRTRRPAPMIMGAGGTVPSRAIDVKKLDSKGTKNLVAQMLEHAKGQN